MLSVARNIALRSVHLAPLRRNGSINHGPMNSLFPASNSRWEQVRFMARYEGEMPELKDKEFVILTPEVSGPGGMSVPAELGEVCELSVKEGDFVKEDAVVAVIDTCKASVEARCRAPGTVKKVLANVGDVVFELHPLYIVEQG